MKERILYIDIFKRGLDRINQVAEMVPAIVEFDDRGVPRRATAFMLHETLDDGTHRHILGSIESLVPDGKGTMFNIATYMPKNREQWLDNLPISICRIKDAEIIESEKLLVSV